VKRSTTKAEYKVMICLT